MGMTPKVSAPAQPRNVVQAYGHTYDLNKPGDVTDYQNMQRKEQLGFIDSAGNELVDPSRSGPGDVAAGIPASMQGAAQQQKQQSYSQTTVLAAPAQQAPKAPDLQQLKSADASKEKTQRTSRARARSPSSSTVLASDPNATGSASGSTILGG